MASWDYLVQQTINAFSLGSIYALVAIGLAMVFGILRLINFAHGDLMMAACYSAFFLITTGIGFIPTLVITILATTAARDANGTGGLSASARALPDVIMLLTSLAVSIFLENVFVMFLSPVPRSFRGVSPAFLDIVNHWGAVSVSNINLVTIGSHRCAICSAAPVRHPYPPRYSDASDLRRLDGSTIGRHQHQHRDHDCLRHRICHGRRGRHALGCAHRQD